MKTIDNKFNKLGDDLKQTILPCSKIQICASIFSMYGFEALKKELSKIESFHFIFTDPTFVEEKSKASSKIDFSVFLLF